MTITFNEKQKQLLVFTLLHVTLIRIGFLIKAHKLCAIYTGINEQMGSQNNHPNDANRCGSDISIVEFRLNCGSVKYISSLHFSFIFMTFRLQNNQNIIIIEKLSKLYEYISPNELKLPGSTTALEQDVKVSSFHRFILFYRFKLSRHLPAQN